MSPFLSAVAHVSALLGPADYERARTVTPDGVLPALAGWYHEGAALTVTDGVDTIDVVLHAERLDGDAREWRAIGEHSVRDACAWLGWSLPRPTLPGLAPVGYDGDGRLTAGDDGCGVLFADPPGDAA